MNILILIRFFTPSVGGSELLFCTIAEKLAENGHKVWVISNKLKGLEYPQHENITTVFVSTHDKQIIKKWSQFNKIKYFFYTLNAAFKIVRNEKIDIIHTNPFEPIVVGSILSFFSSKPHIMTIHDLTPINKKVLEEWINKTKNKKFKAILGSIIMKTIFRLNHAAIHTVSEKSKDDLVSFGEKKPIFVIENAIPLRERIDVSVNPLQFVYVGRLVLYKNITIVLQALKLVKKNFPKVIFIIAGDGDYRENLEKTVIDLGLSDNVFFKGHVSDEEKFQLISSSVAFIFPSLYEGFGLVILEAFMKKTPVLVSDVRPLSDIVENEKTGLILPVNDEKKWARAMEKLLQYPELALKMGEEARKVFEEKYSMDIFYKQIINMYEKVIKK